MNLSVETLSVLHLVFVAGKTLSVFSVSVLEGHQSMQYKVLRIRKIEDQRSVCLFLTVFSVFSYFQFVHVFYRVILVQESCSNV